MEAVIQEEWDSLKPEDWRKCILSIRKRCLAVIKARGGSTKY
jgi:hypothetical protein